MYIQWSFDWPLFLSRDARMCNRQCLHSSMIGMLCTASQGPSQAIQTVLRCPRPESSVLTLDWTGRRFGFVVDLVEEHVGLGGSQFSESILERLCSAHASQQNVVILEFGSPCSLSFSIVCSWLESSWFTTGCPDLSRSVSSPTLNLMLSWQERVWQPSGTFSVFVSTKGCPDLSCASSTLRLLLSSDERVWVLVVSTTGLPRSIQETVSSWKEFTSISWERDVFLPSCTVLVSAPTTGCPDLSVLTTGCFDLSPIGNI